MIRIFLPLLAAMCLIFDSRLAAVSAARGLQLCLQTVVPGLFPLFVLAGILVPQLGTLRFPKGFSRLLGIPPGTEGIFLLGSVGGFPLGARSIAQAVENSGLSPADGARMLGFCDNCGAAFLFGILPAVLPEPWMPLGCFLLQLESALLTAMLWPGVSGAAHRFSPAPISCSCAVTNAVRSMVTVCAWIVLGSVLTGFAEKWLFPFLPRLLRILCTGLLELTAGCMALTGIQDPALRFVVCCGLVNFGGICVLLQIRGVAGSLPMGSCIRQKLLQASFSLVLSAGLLRFGPVFPGICLLLCCFSKKQWNFSKSCGIIAPKREDSDHAVS